METRKKIRIMLIDSDRHVRESIKVFFASGRTQCLVFKSAAQGLNALKYQQVEVVISDYFLPDMDGVAFLNRAVALQPDLIRILMATITTEDLEREIRRSGIDRFIEKPLTVASLDTVINECEIVSNHSRR